MQSLETDCCLPAMASMLFCKFAAFVVMPTPFYKVLRCKHCFSLSLPRTTFPRDFFVRKREVASSSGGPLVFEKRKEKRLRAVAKKKHFYGIYPSGLRPARRGRRILDTIGLKKVVPMKCKRNASRKCQHQSSIHRVHLS